MIRFVCLAADDLCRPEVIEAARHHQLIMLADTNGEEDKVLIKKVLDGIKTCWEYVRPGIDLNLMRMYVNAALDNFPDEFRASVAHDYKYARYLSLMVGALLHNRVFQGAPKTLAKKLATKTGRDRATIERYVYQGRVNLPLIEIFSEVDAKIVKNQYDLCARLKKTNLKIKEYDLHNRHRLLPQQ